MKPAPFRRIRTWVLRSLAILLALLLLVLIAWAAIAGPVTVLRVIRFGDTDITDYKDYPARTLQPAPSPFVYPASSLQDLPGSLALAGGSEVALDTLLDENDSIAFLVIQDGNLVYERYFQDHTPDALSQSFSVAKSFTSALIGLAIEDGYIDSVDQPVTDFIPELAEQGFAEVNIRHLLTMMSGSSYIENDNPFGIHVILNYTPDLRERILGFRMESQPGTIWRYKSGDNALLALILERALAPQTITAYTQERLWTPMGMEYPGIWTLDHEGDGLEKTWCCLAAAATDFAKLGSLYLNLGRWGERQLISSEWIQESLQPAVPENAWDDGYRQIGLRNYGYQWWLASELDGDYLALGKDGQYLYVNPATNTVILRLGWSMGTLPTSQWLALFQDLAHGAQ